MQRIAILVSARLDDDARSKMRADDRPRRDYLELADALNACIINHEQAVAKAWRGRSKTAWGPAFAQAWYAFQRRDEYDCILSDSEHVGIPLALLFKLAGVRKGHVMIGHRLSPKKKALFFRGLRVHSHIDKLICYGSAQRDQAIRLLGVPPNKVELILHPADHLFWRPLSCPQERMICSAGLEFRDYPTLVRAVEGLDVHVAIAAASPWSRRADGTKGGALPGNVSARSYSYAELRELYGRAQFVVVPLQETDFQAGSLVMYEAMAAGKAVVASRTRGQGDILDEGVTGLYVPPGDVDALRRAIFRLLSHYEEAERMGGRARQVVESGLNLDAYVASMVRVVRQVAASEEQQSVELVLT